MKRKLNWFGVVFLVFYGVSVCCFLGSTCAQSPSQISKSFAVKKRLLDSKLEELDDELKDPRLSIYGASKIISKKSEIRRQADELWDDTESKMNAYYRRSVVRARAYENENRQLGMESALLGSQIDLVNNVGKYDKKSEFEKNKGEMSRNWERTYGNRLKPFGPEFEKKKDQLFERIRKKYGVEPSRRIGTINPYTGEVYYKYYGDDGNLRGGAWANDAKGWEKWQKDVDSWRSRLSSVKRDYETDSTEFRGFQTDYGDLKDKTLETFSSIEKKSRYVNFVGIWKGKDSEGDTIELILTKKGEMVYVETLRSSGRIIRSFGTWTQRGRTISMRNDKRTMTWQSSITKTFRIQLNGRNSSKRWTDYLDRK